jgi:hypothetical protein
MKKIECKQIYQPYLIDLYTETPEPGERWQKSSVQERVEMIKGVMSHAELSLIDIRQCNDNGHVYIYLLQPLPASVRGLMLLEFELKLKDAIDEAITIWHTPQGDKSSLRRLRGVEVKS